MNPEKLRVLILQSELEDRAGVTMPKHTEGRGEGVSHEPPFVSIKLTTSVRLVYFDWGGGGSGVGGVMFISSLESESVGQSSSPWMSPFMTPGAAGWAAITGSATAAFIWLSSSVFSSCSCLLSLSCLLCKWRGSLSLSSSSSEVSLPDAASLLLSSLVSSWWLKYLINTKHTEVTRWKCWSGGSVLVFAVYQPPVAQGTITLETRFRCTGTGKLHVPVLV